MKKNQFYNCKHGYARLEIPHVCFLFTYEVYDTAAPGYF